VQCKKEWFHFECVGLGELPKRTKKWYCLDCRKNLNFEPTCTKSHQSLVPDTQQVAPKSKAGSRFVEITSLPNGIDCNDHYVDGFYPSPVMTQIVMPSPKPTATRITRTKAASVNELLVPAAFIKRKASQNLGILSKAVCGKEAFYRLRNLVNNWRDRSKPFFENKNSNAMQIVDAIIGIEEERSQLTNFLNRFAKVKLAGVIDQGSTSRSLNKRTKNRLNDWLKESWRWRKLCGNFDGLLCLIPDREGGYNALIPHDIEQFHSLLSSNEFKCFE